jgi:hypothetical protein
MTWCCGDTAPTAREDRLALLPLAAGDSLRHAPETPNRFSDNGGVVELRTLDDTLTDCAAWGFGRC